MGKFSDSLKNYFENTPQDILDKDWEEIKHLNEIGPDVMDYIEYIEENFLGTSENFLSISYFSDYPDKMISSAITVSQDLDESIYKKNPYYKAA